MEGAWGRGFQWVEGEGSLGTRVLCVLEEREGRIVFSSLLPPSSDTCTANFSTGSPRQDGLFSNEYQRSYLCRRATNIVLNSTANGTVNSSVAILEWQVQAFEFLNDSTFGNGEWTLVS